ncbi:MAG: hypothetical protein ACXIUM_06990 [Wenzhouxiangella sp.]
MDRLLIMLAGLLLTVPAAASGPFLVDPSRSEVLTVSFSPDRSQIASGGLAGVAVFGAIDRADVEPTPSALDLVGFVGDEVRETVSLLSTGDRALRIDKLLLDGVTESDWRIEDIDCLIAPLPNATSCRFELVYAPETLDTAAGVVSIVSNATVAPLELALTASARTIELFRDRFEAAGD